MSSKLKVQELRDALEKRGLDAGGTKPVLVTRLDAALAQEDAQSNATAGKKREATADAEDSEAIPKKRGKGASNDNHSSDTEEENIDKLSVAQLRAALEKRGLPTTGTKKTLHSRLSEAINVAAKSDPDPNQEDGKECDGKEHGEEQNLVLATKKGRAVLDQYLLDHIKSGFHVLETDDGIYDAMLNQTNVAGNNNKFYVIQALESDGSKGNLYHVYTRWGRVGVRGQDKLFGPFTSEDDAISEFEVKFFEKTKNTWAQRHNFTAFKDKYTWLERDYSEDGTEGSDSKEKQKSMEKSKPIVSKPPCQSKLDKRLEQFITSICNLSMMQQQMIEIGYDANKLPLGKLSKATILKGYEALKKIAAVLEGSSSASSLEQLSSEFYTVIPHDFGFQKMRNFVIDTHPKLKRKLEMVEALGEIQLATKLLQQEEEDEDQAYRHYQQLNCHLEPLEHDEEFAWINQYLINTHAKTHSGYELELLNVFKATRQGDENRFQKFSDAKNRMLLWHGSRLTNWMGILSQGLRIAPPEAPVTGYMFGKGVYFADMVSKSANYCCTSKTSPIGVLLLCEVALGEMRELVQADYQANKLPKGKLSTKGVGSTEPNPSEYKILPDGMIVPMGKPVQSPNMRSSLLYNEYIVYNVDQIRMRYVLQVKFKYRY